MFSSAVDKLRGSVCFHASFEIGWQICLFWGLLPGGYMKGAGFTPRVPRLLAKNTDYYATNINVLKSWAMNVSELCTSSETRGKSKLWNKETFSLGTSFHWIAKNILRNSTLWSYTNIKVHLKIMLQTICTIIVVYIVHGSLQTLRL